MSYGRDPDRNHRGVGAIAAVDGAGNRRRRAQARKLAVMSVIDARRAQLAHGPKRALPVSLGRTNLPETDTGSGGSGGGGGGGWTAPTRTPVMSSTQLSTNLATAIAPIKAVSPLSTSIATSLPTTYATPLPTYPTVVIDPVPTSTTPSTPTSPTGGGGGRSPYVPKSGGGGSTFTMPGQPVPTFQPPSEVEDLPPPSSSGSQVSGKTLALVGGGIALLWLLTRKQE